MADINLYPPYSRPIQSTTGIMTVATATYGMIVVPDGANHADVKISIAAGENKLLGVINTIGNPNDSGLFAIGDQVTVAYSGIVEVLFPATTVIARGDVIIASGTDGMGKVLEAETGYCILGYARQAVTIGAAAALASVELSITEIPA